MRRTATVLLVLLALGSALTACSSSQPLAQPQVPSPPAVVSDPPLPSPAPVAASPRPRPTPRSAFENDPAVRALRRNNAATAAAVNARNLRLPALLATVTQRRAVEIRRLRADDLGTYFPGPQPVKVLGVRTLSATSKAILACSAEDGFNLTSKGGRPVEKLSILGGRYTMVLEGGVWKVDRAVADPAVSCRGLTLKQVIG